MRDRLNEGTVLLLRFSVDMFKFSFELLLNKLLAGELENGEPDGSFAFGLRYAPMALSIFLSFVWNGDSFNLYLSMTRPLIAFLLFKCICKNLAVRCSLVSFRTMVFNFTFLILKSYVIVNLFLCVYVSVFVKAFEVIAFGDDNSPVMNMGARSSALESFSCLNTLAF